VKTKLFWFALILLAIWAMKRYYSDAGADNLQWILGPTARLAGGTAGVSFVTEPGTGYLSRERLFLIEKSCAGLNFMIAAFAMLTLTFRRRVTSFCSGAIVLAGSVLIAYSTALIVNAARITIALWLMAHPLAVSRLTPAQSHRVEGVIVYFAGLVLLHELVLQVQRSGGQLRSRV
jgi:exosortase K